MVVLMLVYILSLRSGYIKQEGLCKVSNYPCSIISQRYTKENSTCLISERTLL